MTTGATLVESARALHEAGARLVVGVTIAVPRRRRTRSSSRPAPASTPPLDAPRHAAAGSLPPASEGR
jgi:orotate phosphoribosyltransferase